VVISHRHRFIFVKTAKTAGTSIEVYLSSICGPEDIFTPFAFPEPGHQPRNTRGAFNPLTEFGVVWSHGLRRGARESRRVLREFLWRERLHHMHLPAWQIRHRLGEEVWSSYFTLCVERNPWDKAVSGWRYRNRVYGREATFDEYLAFCSRLKRREMRGVGVWPLNYWNYVHPKTEEVLVDRVLRYEELDAELSDALGDLGIPFTPPLSVRAKASRSAEGGDYRRFYSDRQRELVAQLFAEEIELHGYTFE